MPPKKDPLSLCSHGSYGFKGLKDHYEDRVDARFLEGLGYWFAMYDGHGGARAADFCQNQLHEYVSAAARSRAPDFLGQLEDARETAKRRRLAETTGAHASATTHSEATLAELSKIEEAAKEADERIAELRAVGFGDPELAALADELTGRRAWLDKASKKRKGGEDAARARVAVDEAARGRVEALKAEAAGAAAAATVAVEDDAWRAAIVDAFAAADEEFLKEAERRKWDDGTCACAVLIAAEARKLVLANAGDCRCILARGTRAHRLSVDHKPDTPAEKRRIEAAGGYVVDMAGVWRATCAAGVGFGVDRSKKSLYLAVARSLGDRMLKKPTPVLTARPDVVVKPLGEDDLFCVLVCDGVTDVLDDQRIVDVAAEHLSDPEEAARKVVKEAFAKQAADNITAIVVQFPWVDDATVKAVRARAQKELSEVVAQKNVEEPFDMFA